MSESELGLFPARSQLLGFRPNQGGANEAHHPRRARLRGAGRFPRVGGSEFPQPERGQDCRGPGVPVESRASGFPGPPQPEPQRRAQPRTAVEQGNCSAGRPGSERGGKPAGLSGSPSQRGGCLLSLRIPEGNSSCQTQAAGLCEGESRCSPGWLGVLAQGLPARGPLASDLRGRRGRASTTAPSGARLRRIRGEVPTDLGSQPVGPL